MGPPGSGFVEKPQEDPGCGKSVAVGSVPGMNGDIEVFREGVQIPPPQLGNQAPGHLHRA